MNIQILGFILSMNCILRYEYDKIYFIGCNQCHCKIRSIEKKKKCLLSPQYFFFHSSSSFVISKKEWLYNNKFICKLLTIFNYQVPTIICTILFLFSCFVLVINNIHICVCLCPFKCHWVRVKEYPSIYLHNYRPSLIFITHHYVSLLFAFSLLRTIFWASQTFKGI